MDSATKNVIKFVKKERGKEKLILDFGDAYFLNKFITESKLYKSLKKVFFDKYPEMIPLMIYRLSSQSAMYNCEEWVSGNVLNILWR